MFRDEKNLKDTNLPLPNLPLNRGRSEEGVLSYSKTNKLITALYMVTDIVDREEPLRAKLRTLGIEIISDTYSLPTGQAGAPRRASGKISEVVSFLGIARALNIISSMNCDILEKEFQELDRSIKELTGVGENPGQINLAEFLASPPSPLLDKERGVEGEVRFKGHHLGVQRGSTLLKSLNKMSNTVSHPVNISKGQRRNDILNIIKINGSSATIKDIKDKILTMSPARNASGIADAGGDKGHSLIGIGEKTLQRELISMVANGVLKKEGEKRWSRYFIA